MPVKSHMNPPKPPETRERKGQGFTSHGRRMVRNAAWWLQQTIGRASLSFLTATLPDRALELMELSGQAAGLWAEMIRQYEQWVKRQLRKNGLCEYIVGVSEVQAKRWEESQKVGLHLHWAFQGRVDSSSAWCIRKEEFAEAWLRIVSNVLGEEVESKSVTRVERVKKSIENYLSKYMTKGGECINDIIEAGKRELLPTSWWNITYQLRTLIKSLIVPLSREAGNVLYDTRESLKNQGIIQWFYIHELEMVQSHGEVIKVPVAFVGKFAKPEYKEMFSY